MTKENVGPEKESTERPTASQEADEVERLRAEVESLRQQVERLSAQSEDRLRQWQRAQADLVNFRRRVEQERSEHTKYANERLISRLLPVIDDFERAFAALPRELYSLTWVDGINLIAAKLMATLQQEGLRPIEALGQRYDPKLHEAIIVEPGVDPYLGKVTGELQRGYYLHDRVLRAALVKVGPAEAASESGAQEPPKPSSQDVPSSESEQNHSPE